MGKLDKNILSQFSEFDCERQLYINLGVDDPDWIVPGYQIIPSNRRKKSSQLALDIGKGYEQVIYSNLKRIPNLFCKSSSIGEITPVSLTFQLLNQLYNDFSAQKISQACLLEHQFKVTDQFLEEILLIPATSTIDRSENRPDILILQQLEYNPKSTYYEILYTGEIRQLDQSELASRIAINIIDIKSTNEMNVGKKHFIEIIYYALTLSHFLVENKLDSKYFVCMSANGILPNVENFFVNSFHEIFSYTVELDWQNTYRIFDKLAKTIISFEQKRPLDISQIDCLDVNINPACGRCNFVEDCKSLLGFGNRPPEKWDIRLLPNTSRAIREQFRERNLLDIGSVSKDLASFTIQATPNPLYPQLPLLKMRSQAIITQNPYYPNYGEVYSLSIPKFTDIILIFDNEYDPTTERIYTIGLNLVMSVSPNSKSGYKDRFDGWWVIWKDHLINKTSLATIKDQLETLLNKELNIRELGVLSRIIIELWANPMYENAFTDIILPHEQPQYKDRTTVNFTYTYVNGGLDNANEFQLAKNLVELLYNIFSLSYYIERFITSEPDAEERITKPQFAIFYWTTDQLTVLEEMIERNLFALITDATIKPKLERVISLITPSDSDIKNPLQHKKIFDLRAFAESVVGMPNSVINYTWHELADTLFGIKANKNFWMPHFNYMEYSNWHDFLAELDTNKKEQKRVAITNQIRNKLFSLNRLRTFFQASAGWLVSRKAKPAESAEITWKELPDDYHQLANFWYIYSKLNGSMDLYEADYYRSMFPDFSIGKLCAAKVDNLNFTTASTSRGASIYTYTFELHNLSTNMKISEGDHVLLVPNELRDDGRIPYWKIIVESMEWVDPVTPNSGYYKITTDSVYKNYIEEASEILEKESSEWFLYPTASDNWTNKLYNCRYSTGLLTRYNLGNSWLGHQLAERFGFNFKNKLIKPHNSDFLLSEIYLYAPEFLPENKINTNDKLRLSSAYPPDASQTEAILTALNSTISLIIGPPGTGKSQTIANLVEEFLARNKDRPIKILISTFSYPAAKVLLDKLHDLRDSKNRPNFSSQIQKVFVRSQSREPFNVVVDDDNILDFYRTSGTAWKLDGKSYTTEKNKGKLALDDSFILFSNAHQLYHLYDLNRNAITKGQAIDFIFDLIIVDEASQYPTDHFLSCLQFIHNLTVSFVDEKNTPLEEYSGDLGELVSTMKPKESLQAERLTKVVIVGDNNQLPPVKGIQPPNKLEDVLGSLFDYYSNIHSLPTKQLQINYRSHEVIVEYTSRLNLYEKLIACSANAKKTIDGKISNITQNWLKEVLDPKKIVSTLIHDSYFDMTVSEFEASMTVELILGFYQMNKLKTKEEQKDFWRNRVGIVAPHNAHGRLIIRHIFERLSIDSNCQLSSDELMYELKKAIVSVEKFQGSDRDLIIATMGISDIDQLAAEEEFIYNLNRFNVLTSRAKSKVILLCSRNFLDYMPKAREILDYSTKIRDYALTFCEKTTQLKIKDPTNITRDVEFRYREV